MGGWAQRRFCDLWIDAARELKVAVNAAVVSDWFTKGSDVNVRITSLIGPASLPVMPWSEPWTARLCICGLDAKQQWGLVVDGVRVAQEQSAAALAAGVLVTID